MDPLLVPINVYKKCSHNKNIYNLILNNFHANVLAILWKLVQRYMYITKFQWSSLKKIKISASRSSKGSIERASIINITQVTKCFTQTMFDSVKPFLNWLLSPLRKTAPKVILKGALCKLWSDGVLFEQGTTFVRIFL